jgi:hypothetical protein
MREEGQEGTDERKGMRVMREKEVRTHDEKEMGKW